MIHIGIISQYHDTVNYGGALQAYALCKTLNNMGYESEQIDINFDAECKNLDETLSLKKILRLIKPFNKMAKRVMHQKENEVRNDLRKAFWKFNQEYIAHSAKIYNSKNIVEALKDYEIFITGSDQVWNPRWYFSPFFLTFVPKGIPKLAYAASIAQKELSLKAIELYKEHLNDFRAISVREKNAANLLHDITPLEVEYVLDPTLLLSREQWDEVASDRMINEPYIFCYFLGDNRNARNIAKEYAKNRGLILVNIKHATAKYHEIDIDFGDVKLDAPTPNDFISLIKNADMVFTDSFHAVVFSGIYQRQYFVFNRDVKGSMNIRITDITEVFETQERFCFDMSRENIEYIEALGIIDYSKENVKMDELKQKSLTFLRENIEKCKEK